MTEDELRQLLRTSAPEPPDTPVDRIIGAGRDRGRRRRLAGVTAAAAIAVAVVVLVTTVLRPAAPVVAPASGMCPATVPSGVLPGWARGGFSEPEPVSPYVLGADGDIIAIPFGDLVSPPVPGRDNKVLWVVRDKRESPLTITGRHGFSVFTLQLPDGPGPSALDVPEPGCWTFDLEWGGDRDTLVLPITSGRPR